MDDHRKPVTAADVANHFDVTVDTVRRWVRERRIPFIRISHRVVRFYIEDVEAALSSGSRAETGATA